MNFQQQEAIAIDHHSSPSEANREDDHDDVIVAIDDWSEIEDHDNDPQHHHHVVDNGDDDWNHITKPGIHDVLLGRGGGTNNHPGNIRFRKLVSEHKQRYIAVGKLDKPKVARQVVSIWRNQNPIGRFLARKEDVNKPGAHRRSSVVEDGVWYDVGDRKAREKASQCLRERRTPDIIPCMEHMHELYSALNADQQQGVVPPPMQTYNTAAADSDDGMPEESIIGAIPPPVVHPNNNNGFAADPIISPHHATTSPQGTSCTPNQPHSPPPPHSPVSRRSSFPSITTPSTGSIPQPHPSFNRCYSMDSPAGVRKEQDFNGMPYPADMSEMEYQQQMVMIELKIMRTELEIQRFKQRRMQGRGMLHDYGMPGSYKSLPLGGNMPTVPFQQQQQHQKDKDDDEDEQQDQFKSVASDGATRSNKRGRDDDEGDDDEGHQFYYKPITPDRATRIVPSFTNAPARRSNNNLERTSFEEYCQKLEEYLSNTKGNKGQKEDVNESDLEEKECEQTIQNQQAI